MGLFGFLKFVAKRLLEVSVLLAIFLLMPGIPPDAKFQKATKVPPPRPFEGPLSLNHKLDDVEIWHKGDFVGPETFADYNGQLYTTIHGGDVVKLTGNHITPIVKFGKPCKGLYQEEICGRPLGMTFDKTGTLYVADAYYGVYKVDVNTGNKVRLISPEIEIEGVKPKLPNSVVVTSNGDLYWTDSSSEFSLQDGIFDMLADGSGRLIHYNAKTKRNTVLIKDVHFANGVALSEDEEFIVMAEVGRCRLHRYYLAGPKKDTHDIFIDGLPGLPDNLRSDGKGGFLVPLVVEVDKDHPQILMTLQQFPLLRKFIARTMGVTQYIFKTINRLYPNEFSERSVHFIGHFHMSSYIVVPNRTSILHISKSGEILDSVHNLNGKIPGTSEAHIFKDTLYLGTPFNDYIARIPLSKIGWEHLKKVPVEATTTTTTTTPRPTTTTTPKPTTTTTTTPKPTTTTTTTTPRPTTTTPKPTTTTPKPTQAPTTTTPKPTQAPTTTPRPTQAPTTTPRPTQAPTTTPQPKTAQAPAAQPKATQPTTPPPQAKQPVKEQPKQAPTAETSKPPTTSN